MSDRRLDGKVAIVTGASAGLGEEFCRGLAEAGASVVMAARRLERLEALAGELQEEHRRPMLAVPTDVAVERDVVRMVRVAVSEFGRIDVLVNNAGTVLAKPLIEQTLADWHAVIDVNLTSAFLCSREAARGMISRRSGCIVNISSVFAFGATNEFVEVGYYASKGGMEAMTKALAVELGRHEIRVNAIAPGFFPTEMSAIGVYGPSDEARALRERLIEPRTALPHHAQAHWIRGALTFLASDEASFVTGHTLVVDGGWMAY
jgi:NAD(P)-dependent dehydrogenase (short-subunit alcohol dehydrogenase family)